jgi:hypothetical protein
MAAHRKSLFRPRVNYVVPAGSVGPDKEIMDDWSAGCARDFARQRAFVVLLYSIPSFFCICSSGTPLVSGTMNFTQMSWSTIMAQKKRKT